MKIKKIKHLLLPLLAICMLFSLPVFASETISNTDIAINEEEANHSGEQALLSSDELKEITTNRTGSITVSLTDGKEGTNKTGIRFQCIKVADVINGEYVLTEEFTIAEVDLNNLKNSNELNTAANTLAKYESNGVELTTDTNGELQFEELEVGVYLLKAKDSDTYDTISPTLIAIPTWNEATSDMQYDLTVYPKHSPKPDKLTPSIPQTGIEDHTLLYLGIAISALLFALMIFSLDKKHKNIHKKELDN